jgi:CheY-like chemotaxis protein
MRTVLIVDDNAELASLLAAAAESSGFTAQVATSGREALAAMEISPPDAALVDLLLPDLRGQDIIKAAVERNTTCIAMSGVFRGERYVQEAIALGAKALVEKPFSAGGVMQQLAALLPPATPEAEAEADTAREIEPEDEGSNDDESELAIEFELASDSALPPAPAPNQPEPRQEARSQRIRGPDGDPRVDQPQRIQAPAKDPRGNLPQQIREPDIDARVGLQPRAGLVDEMPLARLLAGLARDKQTAEIRLKRAEVVKVIGLIQGNLAYAASNIASERFLQMAVKAGVLPHESLAKVLAEIQDTKRRTGDVLIDAGYLDEAGRRAIAEAQIKQIVSSALDWRTGTYQLVPRSSPRKDLMPVSLGVGPVVLEGARRALPLGRLRELIPCTARFIAASPPPLDRSELGLSEPEAALLDCVDGTKTIGDLKLLGELDEQATYAFFHGLVELGVLQLDAALPKSARIALF